MSILCLGDCVFKRRTKGEHKEKAEDDSASTATGMRNREASKESHKKTLACEFWRTVEGDEEKGWFRR